MDAITSSVPALILIGAIGIPLLVYALLGVGEKVLAGVPRSTARLLRPWLWLGAPLILVALILVYPLISTIVSAFRNADGSASAGFGNFIWAFTGEMQQVLGNNVIWLIAFPVFTLALALVVAVIFDRVRYERFAMTIIVLPTAISFTAGAIIWRQFFSFQPGGTEQRGLLNALLTLIPGAAPVPWLQTSVVNTFALIAVAVWSSLGVAALILSAAVKNVPGELVEASRLDGAGEWRIFRSITLPSIMPAVLVVFTTEVIFALKVFDIVYVMTNGNFGTDVVANRMYHELFAVRDLGHASAIAVILLIVALPVVILNIRQFQQEEAR